MSPTRIQRERGVTYAEAVHLATTTGDPMPDTPPTVRPPARSGVCICAARRDGTRRCRATVVRESGELACALTDVLDLLLVDHVWAIGEDGEERHDIDVRSDGVGFLRSARAAGWRVEPPRRRRA